MTTEATNKSVYACTLYLDMITMQRLHALIEHLVEGAKGVEHLLEEIDDPTDCGVEDLIMALIGESLEDYEELIEEHMGYQRQLTRELKGK